MERRREQDGAAGREPHHHQHRMRMEVRRACERQLDAAQSTRRTKTRLAKDFLCKLVGPRKEAHQKTMHAERLLDSPNGIQAFFEMESRNGVLLDMRQTGHVTAWSPQVRLLWPAQGQT